MIDVVIFSKNRPLQLYSLLESLDSLTDARDLARVSVVFKYENPYEDEIAEISRSFSFVRFIKQGDFKQDVISCLEGENRFCCFFVDDIIFKGKTRFSDACNILSSNPGILTLSMRMGTHLNFCYPTREQQTIPNGTVQNGFFIWNWQTGEGDWSYPFSVDGHIFRKNEIMNCINDTHFSNPNQFEDRLQILKSINLPNACVCYASSKIVNLPINRVQEEYKNRSEEETPERMLEYWKQGKKIQIEMVSNVNNSSAHFPMSLILTDRN
jgi:hypothetical protein